MAGLIDHVWTKLSRTVFTFNYFAFMSQAIENASFFAEKLHIFLKSMSLQYEFVHSSALAYQILVVIFDQFSLQYS